MDTEEDNAKSLGLKAQWKNSVIYIEMQKALANLTNTDHIVHHYHRNPCPETLEELVQWYESCHTKWEEAPRQLDNLERMRDDVKAHLLRCEKEADEARARGDEEAAGKSERERQNYELTLQGIETQVESARDTVAQIEKAIERQKETIKREKGRVAALFPPRD